MSANRLDPGDVVDVALVAVVVVLPQPQVLHAEEEVVGLSRGAEDEVRPRPRLRSDAAWGDGDFEVLQKDGGRGLIAAGEKEPSADWFNLSDWKLRFCSS